MGRGFLIVLEGVDGAGKTTQAGLLAEALERRGHRVVLTREPSPGPAGQRLRRYLAGPRRDLPPAKELALFLADRREHVAQVIEPALAAGAVVISDRYYFSSVAYQGALDLDPARILAENEAFAPRPDLVFLLTLPLDLARARGRQKPEDPRQLTEDPVYLEKVAALYDTLSGPNLHRVEAAGPPVEVHARLLDLTLQFLKKGS